MDSIQRPKEVPRSQKNYLTERNYQDYSEEQFNNVYDYLDGTSEELNSLNQVAKSGDYNDLTNKVTVGSGLKINSSNKISEDVTELFNNTSGSTSVTLSETVANFYKIRIFWKASRENKTFYGNIELYNVNNVHFVVQVATYNNSATAFSQGTYLMNNKSISLANSSNWEFGNNTSIAMNSNNSTSIVRVEGINRK